MVSAFGRSPHHPPLLQLMQRAYCSEPEAAGESVGRADGRGLGAGATLMWAVVQIKYRKNRG
jgi:hypothetical protein